MPGELAQRRVENGFAGGLAMPLLPRVDRVSAKARAWRHILAISEPAVADEIPLRAVHDAPDDERVLGLVVREDLVGRPVQLKVAHT